MVLILLLKSYLIEINKTFISVSINGDNMENSKLSYLLYEGEIINMFDFLKKKNTHNKKTRYERDFDVDQKINKVNSERDNLLSKYEEINKKLDVILSIPSNEQIDNNNNGKNKKLLNYCNTHPFRISVAASIIAALILSVAGIIYNNYILLPSRVDSIETMLSNSQNSS